MDRTVLIEKIKPVLAERPEVRFAYLFGSAATGKAHSGSDADIAVFFDREMDKMQRFTLRLALADELAFALGLPVDLVDLAATPLPLRYFIRRDGILIMETNKAERVEFEVASRREYFDMKPYLDRRTNAILNRL